MIIKTKDIRIDNLFFYNSETISIESIDGIKEEVNVLDNDWKSGIKIPDLKPIPLNRSLLLQIGFKELLFAMSEPDYVLGKFKVSLSFIDGGNEIEDYYLGIFLSGNNVVHIEYLHQLQNLYWTMIREDLEINNLQYINKDHNCRK